MTRRYAQTYRLFLSIKEKLFMYAIWPYSWVLVLVGHGSRWVHLTVAKVFPSDLFELHRLTALECNDTKSKHDTVQDKKDLNFKKEFFTREGIL